MGTGICGGRRGYSDQVSIDTMLSRQNPFTGAGRSFDLRGARFITPPALSQLAAACHALAATGSRPVIICTSIDLRRYLMRAGLSTALRGIAEFDPPLKRLDRLRYEGRRGEHPLLIEVTRIEDSRALSDLLDRIVRILLNSLGYSGRDAVRVVQAISEVGQNTIEHNDQACGFLALQVYRRDTPAQYLQIGLADHGDGLLASLQSNPAHASISTHHEAIDRAMQRGISRHDDPTHGTGLHHLQAIVGSYRGSVEIRSGDTSLHYRADTNRRWWTSVVPMPGTHVAISLPRGDRP